ncbi:MAG: phospholipase D-like domain-containing protein [Micavibrio sp.]
MKLEEEILDGDRLRKKLESTLPHARESIIFISAYITQSAIDWLIKCTPDKTDTHIICRLIPSDIMTGATQLSAVKTALDKGIKVSCLHSLHAKIYAIDSETIFVGSANLTNNGLKIYGNGNLEACSQVPANNLNLNFIQNIVDSSTPLDAEIIQSMQGCIDLKENSVFLDRWPEGVLKEQDGIWVRDFFWAQPDIEKDSVEQIHDFEVLGIESAASAKKITKQQLLRTRCIKWLITKLEIEPENELYFGKLTKILHDELKDDPAPYRKDVKSLVQNLLTYCQKYLPDIIEITQPNHSQRIRLLVSE